jgi:hypothetical protein
MKSFRILTTAVSFGVILVLFGCGGKGTPAESTQDKQLRLLSQTWKVSSVTLDTKDQTSTWTNFQLTISGVKGQTTFNYACANRPTTLGPWDASGTWKFGADDPVTQIIRIEDNLNMSYIATETTLQINFNYNGPGFKGPRLSNVTGNWIFNFTK